MTTAGQREDRFGDITKVRALGTRFYAMSGERNTVIVAANVANVATVVGETAALGSDARDIASNGNTQLYILTDLGLQVATLADQPVLVAKYPFTVGAGRWVLYSGGYVFAPAPGGLRVIDPAIGEVSQSTAYGVSDIALARLTSDGLIYGVDQKRAKIHVWRIIGARAKYISSFPAHNCRDVTQMVIDETAHILFIQCKHRVIGFNIPSSGAVDDSILVTLRQDYGKLDEEYTDLVQIGANKYWFGVNADSPLNAGSAFLGRTFAAWDTSAQAMVAAFPDVAMFATSDVTPYVGELYIPPVPGIPEIPAIVPPVVPIIPVVPPYVPPIVAVPKPVITSALTATVTEDTVFSYTITATGTGPIYYDVVGAPGWVTSINHTTGVVLGMPTDPGTANITITATNAGGTTSAALVVTVRPALASLAAVSVNNSVYWIEVVGSVAYILGVFTSVTDASGTLTRNHAAALDLPTGLWTAWNPAPNGVEARACKYWNGWLYIGGPFTNIGGQSRTILARVNLTTGAADPSWTQNANGGVESMYASDKLYICGGINNVNGSGVDNDGILAYDSSGTLTSWATNDSRGVYGVLDSNGTSAKDIVEVGGVLYRTGSGRIGPGPTEGREIFALSKSNGRSVLAMNSKEFNVGAYGASVVTISANLVVGATIGGPAVWINTGADVGDYARGPVIKITTNCGIDLSYNPTFNGAARRIVSRGTNDYVAGDFTTVNGSAQRLLTQLASDGSTVSGFAPVITVATSADAIALYASSLLVGIQGSPATVGGVSKGYFFAVDQATGALQ